MKRYIAIVLALVLLFAVGISAAPDWKSCRTAAHGHTDGGNGHDIPSVTVILFDSKNSNPRAQEQVWIITEQAYAGKTRAIFKDGEYFEAYRVGETSRNYGLLAVKTIDEKGKEHSELHPILGAS